jgi:hypothetical protein
MSQSFGYLWRRSDKTSHWLASLDIGLAIFNVVVGLNAWNWYSLINFGSAVFVLYLAKLQLRLGVQRRERKLFDEIRENWYNN